MVHSLASAPERGIIITGSSADGSDAKVSEGLAVSDCGDFFGSTKELANEASGNAAQTEITGEEYYRSRTKDAMYMINVYPNKKKSSPTRRERRKRDSRIRKMRYGRK